MNRHLICAAALLAGIAVAAPAAWSAEGPAAEGPATEGPAAGPAADGPQTGHAPSEAGRAATGGMMGDHDDGMGMMGGMREHDDGKGMMGGMREHGGMGMMGGMREHGGMGMMGRHGMHEMMMHGRMHGSSQQRCEERLARRAAAVAYAGARLKLTAEQRPIWEKLTGTLQASREKQQQFCDSLKPSGDGAQPTVLDRLNRAEQYLSTQLDVLHQVRPNLEELYRALTPEQKSLVDRIGIRG